MMYSNVVKELEFQYIEHGILRYDFVYEIRYVFVIRGNLGSKMGLIRKRTNNKFGELEFKNQYNFNKMIQP